eukprot:664392-Rhodomonas_salina.2
MLCLLGGVLLPTNFLLRAISSIDFCDAAARCMQVPARDLHNRQVPTPPSSFSRCAMSGPDTESGSSQSVGRAPQVAVEEGRDRQAGTTEISGESEAVALCLYPGHGEIKDKQPQAWYKRYSVCEALHLISRCVQVALGEMDKVVQVLRTGLRACYVMSGTDRACGCTGLRACYAMPRTGLPYAAICLRSVAREVRYLSRVCCYQACLKDLNRRKEAGQLRYLPTRLLRDARLCGSGTDLAICLRACYRYIDLAIGLRACYALFSTDPVRGTDIVRFWTQALRRFTLSSAAGCTPAAGLPPFCCYFRGNAAIYGSNAGKFAAIYPGTAKTPLLCGAMRRCMA